MKPASRPRMRVRAGVPAATRAPRVPAASPPGSLLGLVHDAAGVPDAAGLTGATQSSDTVQPSHQVAAAWLASDNLLMPHLPWFVTGTPSGKALIEAIARVVDDLDERMRAHLEGR